MVIFVQVRPALWLSHSTVGEARYAMSPTASAWSARLDDEESLNVTVEKKRVLQCSPSVVEATRTGTLPDP